MANRADAMTPTRRQYVPAWQHERLKEKYDNMRKRIKKLERELDAQLEKPTTFGQPKTKWSTGGRFRE